MCVCAYEVSTIATGRDEAMMLSKQGTEREIRWAIVGWIDTGVVKGGCGRERPQEGWLEDGGRGWRVG